MPHLASPCSRGRTQVSKPGASVSFDDVFLKYQEPGASPPRGPAFSLARPRSPSPGVASPERWLRRGLRTLPGSAFGPQAPSGLQLESAESESGDQAGMHLICPTILPRRLVFSHPTHCVSFSGTWCLPLTEPVTSWGCANKVQSGPPKYKAIRCLYPCLRFCPYDPITRFFYAPARRLYTPQQMDPCVTTRSIWTRPCAVLRSRSRPPTPPAQARRSILAGPSGACLERSKTHRHRQT